MPKGYIIGHITVHDAERYKTYIERDTPILLGHGAEFLIRGGQSDIVEGSAEARHVMIAFDSYESACASYDDPAYQEVAEIRRATAKSTILIAEGHDEDLPKDDGPLGYILAHVAVHDPEAYAPYVAGNTPVMRRHGARYIIRGGRAQVMEGTAGGRHVVIAFPSYQAARDAYHDPEYQKLIKIRQAHSTGTLILAEGA